MASSNTVNYLNKDFNSLKRGLIRFARENFPNANQDFNDASSAGMLVEMIAYAGDVLSYYIDHSFNEQFIDTAVETTNIQRIAKRYGYKASGPTPAIALCKFYIELPTKSGNTNEPDLTAGMKLLPGSSFTSDTGIDFFLVNTIDFTNTIGARIIQGTLNASGVPTTYIIEKEGYCISGTTKTIYIPVGSFLPFREVILPIKDVTTILSVNDSSGNPYYEVENLFQNTVYQVVNNIGKTTSNDPDDLIKMVKVSRRYTSEFQLGSRLMKLTFGSGDPSNSSDTDSVPNPAQFATSFWGKTTFSSFTIDPRNFTNSPTLGIAPANTTLAVKVRFGGGNGHNVPAKTIRKIKVKDVVFPNNESLSTAVKKQVLDSLSITNPAPAYGGTNPPTLEEVRIIAPAYYASQNRTVTIEDFMARVMSLPQSLGNVFRVTAERSQINKGTVNIRTVSRDINGKLITTSQDTKNNISQMLYPNRMLSDNIQILDAIIINLGIEISIIARTNYNINVLKENILSALSTFFDITNFYIGQHILEDEIRTLVYSFPGVAAITDIKFNNIRGTVDGNVYSNTRYDIEPSEKRQGILECPRNGIFEVRYPNKNIKISIK